MSCLRLRDARRGIGPARATMAGLILAVTLSGCVAARQSPVYQSYAGAPSPTRVAAAVPPPQTPVEADGLPQQVPPRLRARPERDDPTEPFSPNYGPPPDGHETPVATPTQAALRREVFGDTKAERLIAQAIAAHEVRRP